MISRQTHSGYEETARITPKERKYLLQFIYDDLEKQQNAINKIRNQRKGQR